MSWIDDNKGQGPWEFSKQPNKPYYNEGNLISDFNDPIWGTDHLSFFDEPITPTHHPWCGYWHKDCECNCVGIAIGYTTSQMSCDEDQALTVENSVDRCVYKWEITDSEGRGSLSSSTGTSVIYTAPSSNMNCAYNPTIQLSVGDVCDSITIAVNEWTGNENAYRVWERYHYSVTCPGIYEKGTSFPCPCNDVSGNLICCPSYYGVVDYYRCDGILNQTTLHCSKNSYGKVANCDVCDTRCPPLISDCITCMEAVYTFGAAFDLRTEAMKEEGCCPEALL